MSAKVLDFELMHRHAAIIWLDKEWAKRELPEDASDYEIIMALHKARFELTTCPDQQRIASGKWLQMHNAVRLTGEPIDLENLPE